MGAVAVWLPGHGEVLLRLEQQSSSRLLRWARRFLPAVRSAWVTLDRVIYHPDGVLEPWGETRILAHEWVHVRQWVRMGRLRFAAKYATAGGRWEIEREAYLHEIRYFGRSIDSCVEDLAGPLYKLSISRGEMAAWFARALMEAA